MSRIDPRLKKFSRQLRSGTTDAENKLWSLLRRRQVEGFQFRRQFVIGKFIADFCCRERKLVIELDGGQHNEEVRDITRSQFMEAEGYRVIRFWNNDVLGHTGNVLEEIRRRLLEPPPP